MSISELRRDASVHTLSKPIMASLFPSKEALRSFIEPASENFVLSAREYVHAYASAASIVVLEGTNGEWGVYRGCHNTDRDFGRVHSPEERNKMKTLSDFLNTWRGLGIKTRYALLCAGGFCDDAVETVGYRRDVKGWVVSGTGLQEDRVIEKWNDEPEGDTQVMLDPLARIIKINQT